MQRHQWSRYQVAFTISGMHFIIINQVYGHYHSVKCLSYYVLDSTEFSCSFYSWNHFAA